MVNQMTTLSTGYHDIAPDTIAAVVTTLEMKSAPELRPENNAPNWQLVHCSTLTLEKYRAIYQRVGEDWLWRSRLAMADEQLAKIIYDPKVAIYTLTTEQGIGLLELDFRVNNECELAFFGLSKGLIGSGAGRWLMNRALQIVWQHPIKRFWVHTCTLDHPAALDFYQRSGFQPILRQVEVMTDPRAVGLLPKTAAPQVPYLADD